MDVLGFKSREMSNDPSVVADALAVARDSVTSVARTITKHSGKDPVETKFAWFSDTICLIAQMPNGFPAATARRAGCTPAAACEHLKILAASVASLRLLI